MVFLYTKRIAKVVCFAVTNFYGVQSKSGAAGPLAGVTGEKRSAAVLQ